MVEFLADLSWELSDMTTDGDGAGGQLEGAAEEALRGGTKGKT